MMETVYTVNEAAHILGINHRTLRHHLKRTEFAERVGRIETSTPFGPRKVMTISADLLEDVRKVAGRQAKLNSTASIDVPGVPSPADVITAHSQYDREFEAVEKLMVAMPALAVAELTALLSLAGEEACRVLDDTNTLFQSDTKDSRKRIFLLALSHALRTQACLPSQDIILQLMWNKTVGT